MLVLKSVRYAAFISILYSIMFSFNEGTAIKFLLSSLLILIAVNDFIRVRFIQNHESIWYYSSFILSNIIGAYFTYKVSCIGTAVYNVILLIDIIIFNGKPSNFLLIFNFIAFCIPYKIYINPENLKDIFINYSISFIIVYIVRSVFMEKIRTEELNKELTNANSKLKEYSEKIEELTVAKERTRIAQELHDSIGHSLIALNMNLEYAENVVDLKPERAKEVINKAHNISKDCIVKLREVVSVLKEDNSIDNLSNEIKKLFENFYNDEKYKFNFKMDEDIENEDPIIKSCIYKTIMESITNGIKHGDAEIFDIEIIKACNNIRFKISNNGLGCSDIKKSNGIKGIEKRIAELGGTVEFYSENKIGFTIDATIPVGGRKL